MTTSIMSMICWISLASRVVAAVPQPSQKPFSMSWNVISDMSRKFSSLDIFLQITSTSLIPLKLPLFPLGIKTDVYHLHSSTSVPSRNGTYTMETTLYQLVASGVSSQAAAIRHWRSCSWIYTTYSIVKISTINIKFRSDVVSCHW